MNEDTEEEINEIITKNYLQSKDIPFKKLGEYAAGGTAPPKSANKEEKKDEKAAKQAEA